jgi:hypothetical protein
VQAPKLIIKEWSNKGKIEAEDGGVVERRRQVERSEKALVKILKP